MRKKLIGHHARLRENDHLPLRRAQPYEKAAIFLCARANYARNYAHAQIAQKKLIRSVPVQTQLKIAVLLNAPYSVLLQSAYTVISEHRIRWKHCIPPLIYARVHLDNNTKSTLIPFAVVIMLKLKLRDQSLSSVGYGTNEKIASCLSVRFIFSYITNIKS